MSAVNRILYNGNIHTFAEQHSQATALAIAQGRVVAVGDDTSMLALAGPGTLCEDLAGQFLIPGLTDAHLHWAMTAQMLGWVDVFEVPSRDEAIRRVAERVSVTPVGQWIEGHGWSQDFWPEPVFPDAVELDKISPAHPVFLIAKSGHAAWVNTLVLRQSGITAQTLDPPGGRIERDSAGNPTGILFETAMDLVQIPSPSPENLADMMAQAQQQALAAGLTGFHDFDGPDCLCALQLLREQQRLSLRVVKHVNDDWLDGLLAAGVRSGFGDEWLRLGAQKIFADGALGPKTAAMLAPYADDASNYGMSLIEKNEMLARVSRASIAGFPTAIHAIGDRAVRDVLDVFEAVRTEEAMRGIKRTARRHRIEHVQLIHPDDAHRLAALDIIASMQPLHATSDYEAADRLWGARCEWGYNIRLQLDAGARVALGTDSPIEPFAPLRSIHAAVTRRRPDGSPGIDGWYPALRLSMTEALEGFTTGPAYAAGLERCAGKLMPGYFADLVVLNQDLYAINPEEILNVQVVGTMVNGEWRYGGI